MFTGIVERIGKIRSIGKNGRFEISSEFSDLEQGESIAVNGCCLTVVTCSEGLFGVDIVAETMSKTNLGRLEVNSTVNLERAMRPSDRFGGHIVLGHVDGTGEIRQLEERQSEHWLSIEIPRGLERYVIPVGSIAIEGISLTVARIEANLVSCAIIPFTWERTNLSSRTVGDVLNIEIDMIAKHIGKLSTLSPDSTIDMDFLKKHGYA